MHTQQYGVVQASKVGPTVAEDKNHAYWAVLGAMLIVSLFVNQF
jgi:preprotein translocase subunit SecF